MLATLGVPEEFIEWLKTLYKEARIKAFINGYLSDAFEVKSGVRQGDPISCPLFVAVIEGLAQLIIKDSRIKGIRTGGRYIKVLMFADDTAIILRNQAEADAAMEILDTYSKALGAKVNTTKLYLIKIGEPPTVQLPGMKMVSDDDLYEHLGIPLGIRNMQQLQRY